MNSRIQQQQLDFSLKIDASKDVFRRTHLSHHGRRENDAEHAWHMTIMAYLLKEYANEPVDISKVMIMCLIHDLVEIEAGDTFAHDEKAKQSEEEREDAAKLKVFSSLPEDQKNEFISLFDEFTEGNTPEAKFARAMDNLQPLLLNDSNQGSDWKENHVTYDKVIKRHEKTLEGSRQIYDVVQEILEKNIQQGNLKR